MLEELIKGFEEIPETKQKETIAKEISALRILTKRLCQDNNLTAAEVVSEKNIDYFTDLYRDIVLAKEELAAYIINSIK